MTEDCGYETSKGTPCQHPAGDDGYCWMHPDKDSKGGRSSKFDDEAEQACLEAAREGKSKAGCARSAGVGKATLERWLDEHGEFRNGFAQARAIGESKLLQGGLSDPDVDSSMAKFLLASSFDYVKAEKREMEHSGEIDGFDFTINASTDD